MGCEMVKPEFDWGKDFDEYLESLSLKDEAKIRALIDRIENNKLQDSIRKDRVKKLNDTIYEIRAQTDEHWLRGCYFQIKGTHYYITHGFNKNTNKTPSKEISRAEKIRQDFLSQNRRNEK